MLLRSLIRSWVAFSDTVPTRASSKPFPRRFDLDPHSEIHAGRPGQVREDLIADFLEVQAVPVVAEFLGAEEAGLSWFLRIRRWTVTRPGSSGFDGVTASSPSTGNLGIALPHRDVRAHDEQVVADDDGFGVGRKHRALVALRELVVALGEGEPFLLPEQWLLAQAATEHGLVAQPRHVGVGGVDLP